KAEVVSYLRPDGKTQVTVRYVDGRPVAIEKVLISAQHREGAEAVIREDLWDSSSFGGESERSREPDVLLHPPQCQPSGAEARIASRELWAAGTGPGLLPVLLSRGFVRGGRGRGIPCACRGAGWLREVVARRPWMAGGIGTDDVSQKGARLGRWPRGREPRGYKGIHGRGVQRTTPKRRGEPTNRHPPRAQNPRQHTPRLHPRRPSRARNLNSLQRHDFPPPSRTSIRFGGRRSAFTAGSAAEGHDIEAIERHDRRSGQVVVPARRPDSNRVPTRGQRAGVEPQLLVGCIGVVGVDRDRGPVVDLNSGDAAEWRIGAEQTR